MPHKEVTHTSHFRLCEAAADIVALQEKPNLLLQFPLFILWNLESCWQEACTLNQTLDSVKNPKISVINLYCAA